LFSLSKEKVCSKPIHLEKDRNIYRIRSKGWPTWGRKGSLAGIDAVRKLDRHI
jgi:hypothetical protein